jgi:nitrogen PTS system EIIA component
LIGEAAPSIRDWIRPGLVHCDLHAADADGALREIAGILASACPVCGADAIFRGLRDRERLGSTAVGGGCAIPHLRLAALRETMLAVVRSAEGIAFGAPDGRPVRLFFGLAAPAGAASPHLRVLSSIARWLRDPRHRDALLGAPDAAAMRAALGVA